MGILNLNKPASHVSDTFNTATSKSIDEPYQIEMSQADKLSPIESKGIADVNPFSGVKNVK